eukprot:666172-Pyramimonas_sp.AAC.1
MVTMIELQYSGVRCRSKNTPVALNLTFQNGTTWRKHMVNGGGCVVVCDALSSTATFEATLGSLTWLLDQTTRVLRKSERKTAFGPPLSKVTKLQKQGGIMQEQTRADLPPDSWRQSFRG